MPSVSVRSGKPSPTGCASGKFTPMSSRPILKPALFLLTSNSYVGDGNLTDLRFLLIKEHPSDFEIADVLREQHAEVFALPIYQTLIADKTENVRLKTLIKGGAVDEFIFSAPEDLIALKHYFPGDNLKKHILGNTNFNA